MQELIMDIKRFLKAAADLMLPRMCAVCGRRLNLEERHICLGCLADMPLTRYWERGRNPMADKFNERIQRGLEEALTEKKRTEGKEDEHIDNEHYAYAAALFFYHSEAGYRHIPYQIKYHGNIALGKYFGKMLGRKLAGRGRTEAPRGEGREDLKAERQGKNIRSIIAETGGEGRGGQSEDAREGDRIWKDVDLVIPVPLHWTRRWKRGYNQAEVIARAVAETMGIPIRTDVLERRRRTKTQVKVKIEDKGRNVEGAFAVTETARLEVEETRSGKTAMVPDNGGSKGYLGDVRHILLVDDVFTTGSTLAACHSALRTVFPPHIRISAITLGYLER